ncbi:thioredoxin family protein [Candidatus Woesearchaeota archaeon]|nr:thioredoxin family protein [Candidatus Woesearchaeota archaeon]
MVLLQSETQMLKKGDTAPDFSLQNVDGKTVRLSACREKPVVVIFMCNHCPFVKTKFTEIAQLQHDFEKKGVAFLLINPNDADNYSEDSYENMQTLAKEQGYHYYLYDETQEVAKAYGAVCTPDPFVFDKEHKLVYHGRINNAMNPQDKATKHDLREVLDALLLGKAPAQWFVPSQGCSIKWKE